MIIFFFEPIRMHEQAAGRDVTLGYGLHYGWAIEGAIGSNLKTDASYLSPHVNTAARLEAATKQFRTMFLLSDDFVKRLSPRNQVSVSVNTVVCIAVTSAARFAPFASAAAGICILVLNP